MLEVWKPPYGTLYYFDFSSVFKYWHFVDIEFKLYEDNIISYTLLLHVWNLFLYSLHVIFIWF